MNKQQLFEFNKIWVSWRNPNRISAGQSIDTIHTCSCSGICSQGTGYIPVAALVSVPRVLASGYTCSCSGICSQGTGGPSAGRSISSLSKIASQSTYRLARTKNVLHNNNNYYYFIWYYWNADIPWIWQYPWRSRALPAWTGRITRHRSQGSCRICHLHYRAAVKRSILESYISLEYVESGWHTTVSLNFFP